MEERVNNHSLAGVNLIGYLTSASGLGQIARGYASALEHLNVSVDCRNVSASSDATRYEAGEKRPPDNARAANPVNLLVANPHPSEILHLARQIDFSSLRNAYNIGCWWWELSGPVPHCWRRGASIVDELWAGSSFVRNTLMQQFAGPVRLIPPVVEQGFVTKSPASLRSDPSQFVFLFICDFNSVAQRKNPLAVVNAFKAAFGPSESVKLIVKVRNVGSDPVYWQALCNAAAGANVTLLNSELSRDELDALRQDCDCYVSLHRSEGFGLTLAEAMLAGKPVVATAWSGNMDFMTERNSYLVPYQLVKVGADCRPYSRDDYWAEPDLRAAAEMLRAVYENRELAREKGQLGRKTIQSSNSVAVVASAISSVLQELAFNDFQKLTGNKLISVPRAKPRFQPGIVTGGSEQRCPTVSICLPVWNGEEYLPEAIESVLNQSFADFELLISDDSSDDASLEIIKGYANGDSRIRFWSNERRLGIFANLNRCMERSRGQFIKLFAQDDLLQPEILSEAVTTLRNHPEVALYVAKRSLIDERGSELDNSSPLASIDVKIALDSVVPGRAAIESCLFPVVNRIGEPCTVTIPRRFIGSGFDDAFYQLGDLDFWFQLLQKGDLYQSSKILCKFRQHGASATTSNIGGLLFATDIIRLGRKYEALLGALGRGLDDFMERELDSVSETVSIMTDSDFYFGELALKELPAPIDVGLFRELAIRALRRPTRIYVDQHAQRKLLAERIKVMEHEVQTLLSSRSWLATKVLRGTRKYLTRKARKSSNELNSSLNAGDNRLAGGERSPSRKGDSNHESPELAVGTHEAELQAYLLQLRRQRKGILNSLSWTITKPLRKAGLL
jgi:glycosyltransferase involved in cell wall biosynthesis